MLYELEKLSKIHNPFLIYDPDPIINIKIGEYVLRFVFDKVCCNYPYISSYYTPLPNTKTIKSTIYAKYLQPDQKSNQLISLLETQEPILADSFEVDFEDDERCNKIYVTYYKDKKTMYTLEIGNFQGCIRYHLPFEIIYKTQRVRKYEL